MFTARCAQLKNETPKSTDSKKVRSNTSPYRYGCYSIGNSSWKNKRDHKNKNKRNHIARKFITDRSIKSQSRCILHSTPRCGALHSERGYSSERLLQEAISKQFPFNFSHLHPSSRTDGYSSQHCFATLQQCRCNPIMNLGLPIINKRVQVRLRVRMYLIIQLLHSRQAYLMRL